MENETAATAENGTTANGANGPHADTAVGPRPTPERPAVRYMTNEEADQAAEEVFRYHRPLLAELAK